MKRYCFFAFLLWPVAVHAGHGTSVGNSAPVSDVGSGWIRGRDWATGEDISLGGVVFPSLQFSMGYAASTGDPEELAVGHHDMNREGVTFQNIELGASIRGGEHLEGFLAYVGVIDHDDQWSGSLEEVFGKFKELPGGFEVRAGRYFNRFGFYNAVHPHAYPLVNRDLLEARMLGEDSVTSEGAEITWRFPDTSLQWSGAVALSYGGAFLEDEHGHEHEHEEALFEPDGAAISDDVFSAHALVKYNHNDFHQWTGLASFMTGENLYGRHTNVGALGVEYLWRENGLEAGGRFFRWRTEAMYRRAEAKGQGEGGPAIQRTFDESGLSTSAFYGFNDHLQAGLGLAWVQGISPAGLEERLRVSPLVQWNIGQNVNLRAQYDYDYGEHFGGEHTLGVQLNLSWGSHGAH